MDFTYTLQIALNNSGNFFFEIFSSYLDMNSAPILLELTALVQRSQFNECVIDPRSGSCTTIILRKYAYNVCCWALLLR